MTYTMIINQTLDAYHTTTIVCQANKSQMFSVVIFHIIIVDTFGKGGKTEHFINQWFCYRYSKMSMVSRSIDLASKLGCE